MDYKVSSRIETVTIHYEPQPAPEEGNPFTLPLKEAEALYKVLDPTLTM